MRHTHTHTLAEWGGKGAANTAGEQKTATGGRSLGLSVGEYIINYADPTVPGAMGVGLRHQPVFMGSHNTHVKGGSAQ